MADTRSILLPICMYHQVAPRNDPAFEPYLYITPETLEKQIHQLQQSGWSFLTLGAAWERIANGEECPKAVCLTFDDLSMRFSRHALPVLETAGVPATGFAIAGALTGASLKHLDSRLALPRAEELRALAAAGIEIGSHGLSHSPFTTLADEELAREMTESRAALQEALGADVTSLCHPRGRCSPRIEAAAAEAGYHCACSTVRGTVHQADERFRLKRIRMHENRTGLNLRYATTRLYGWWNEKRVTRDLAAFAAEEKASSGKIENT